MALGRESNLETVSYVLTKSQASRMRSLAELRSTELRRVSVSDVARDVVEQGLKVILHNQNTDSIASVTGDAEVAA